MSENEGEVIAINDEVLPYLEEHIESDDLIEQIVRWGVEKGSELGKAYPDNCLICQMTRAQINIEGELLMRLILSVFVSNCTVEQLALTSRNMVLFEDEKNNITGFREVEAVTLN